MAVNVHSAFDILSPLVILVSRQSLLTVTAVSRVYLPYLLSFVHPNSAGTSSSNS
jgi:hypothetical protein